MAFGNSNWSGFSWAGGNPAGLGEPVDPDAPTNNIDSVADGLHGRLGCGEPAAFISFRCGATTCPLPLETITYLQYDRRLNEISEAEVRLAITGDSFRACCECLAQTEPWCHELHIWRDGAEAWVGPIQTIQYGREEISITAKDVLAWTDVFVPPFDIDYTNPLGTDLAEIAEDIITLAFADNPWSCEIPYMHVETDPTNIFGQRFFQAFTGNAFEFLDALAESGVFYTTLGRTIFIAAPSSGEPIGLTRLALLTDEHVLGDITVTKDGDLQGNRFYVHWDGDLGVPEVSTAAEMYCSGPVERLREGTGLVTEDSAQQAADAYVAAQTIAPRIVEIPTGSRLSPETPVTIGRLVPGALFDVSLTKLCISVTQTFRLLKVEVQYSPGDGEEILVDLETLNIPEG